MSGNNFEGLEMDMINAPESSERTSLHCQRHSESDLETKRGLWRVLAERLFQHHVPSDRAFDDVRTGNCAPGNPEAARSVTLELNPRQDHLSLTHLYLIVPSFLDCTVEDLPIGILYVVIGAYLAVAIVWTIFGRQMLVLGFRC
jgi:hypothetical protein